MSTFVEIQKLAADRTADMPTLLRMCIDLGTRLNSASLKNWAGNELNGYDFGEFLPKYRILNVRSFGEFVANFKPDVLKATISTGQLPAELHELATTEFVVDGVEVLAKKIKSAANGVVAVPWPRDIIDQYGRKIYQEMNCLSIWRAVDQKQLSGIIDTVRNRILSFALKVKTEFPADFGATQQEAFSSRGEIEELFESLVYKSLSSAAIPGPEYASSARLRVHKGDMPSLQKFLVEAGVSKEEVEELRKYLTESEHARLDKQVASWMGRMVLQSSLGNWRVPKPVATDILTKALSRYFGTK